MAICVVEISGSSFLNSSICSLIVFFSFVFILFFAVSAFGQVKGVLDTGVVMSLSGVVLQSGSYPTPEAVKMISDTRKVAYCNMRDMFGSYLSFEEFSLCQQVLEVSRSLSF